MEAGGGVGVGAPGPAGCWSAGATVVDGSPLPPDISAVLASGTDVGGGTSSSEPLSCGANTVAGSGTERSSPESPLVSVPAQGVAPAGVGGGVGVGTPPSVRGNDSSAAPGAAADGTAEGAAEAEGAAADDGEAAASPIPSRSAASCNHSGGDSRNASKGPRNEPSAAVRAKGWGPRARGPPVMAS